MASTQIQSYLIFTALTVHSSRLEKQIRKMRQVQKTPKFPRQTEIMVRPSEMRSFLKKEQSIIRN